MTNQKHKFPITLNWVKYNSKYDIPIIYDENIELIDEINTYLLEIASKKIDKEPSTQGYKSEIKHHTYALKSYISFLSQYKLDWKNINDNNLISFRNWSYLKTLANSRSKKKINSAKRTTNGKLRAIYLYYVWAQNTMLYVSDIIGNSDEFPIKSILPDFITSNSIKGNDSRLYPLCYERCGEGSHSRFQYSATYEDKIKLIKYFSDSTSTEYIADRNILVMEIAAQVGWRSGSITSLTISDFSDEVINSATDENILIEPKIQKLGYENSFKVTLALAIRVNKHIKTSRQNIINYRKIKNHITQNSLFLSSVSCTPIGPQTFIQIFSKAMKHIGCPRGSGIHSFRRKFAQDITNKEVAFRLKNKLSLAMEDTLLVTARALGQASKSSPESYLNARISESEKGVEAELLRENSILASELASALLEKERLIRLLKKSAKN